MAWTIDQAARHGIPQADAVNIQRQIAQAALKIETARLHVYRGVDEIDSSDLQCEARTLIRAEAGHDAQQLLDAINILLNVHVAGSMADENPLRYGRDISAGARPASVNPAARYASPPSELSADLHGRLVHAGPRAVESRCA